MRYLITGSSRGLGKALIDQLSSNNNEIVELADLKLIVQNIKISH